MYIKKFLSLYIQRGELKSLADQAGIHPNTVYSWIKSRNNPHIMSLIWFFRALSREKNVQYEMLWIEFLYLLEGRKDPQADARDWLRNHIDSMVRADRSWLKKHFESMVLEVENAQR